MSTAKMPHPTKRAKAASHIENTTDATRGQPLALRAKQRKAELEHILKAMRGDDIVERKNIERALSEIDQWLVGDVEHLSKVTGENISRWLEGTKHLAESAPKARRSIKH